MVENKCADFLGSMRKIETLAYSTYRLHTSEWSRTSLKIPSLVRVFGNNGWPHLTSLTLGRLFTSGSQLTDLFRRHKNTLTTLSMKDVLLHGGSWPEVLADLTRFALQKIELQHLRYGHEEGDREEQHFLNDLAIFTMIKSTTLVGLQVRWLSSMQVHERYDSLLAHLGIRAVVKSITGMAYGQFWQQ